MSWHYKPPMSFPALYLNVLRSAALSPGVPIILGAASDGTKLKILAEKFRWFKYCIRLHNERPDLTEILNNYDVRACYKPDNLGSILYITATPTKVSEFIRLNPELADEVLPQCQ